MSFRQFAKKTLPPAFRQNKFKEIINPNWRYGQFLIYCDPNSGLSYDCKFISQQSHTTSLVLIGTNYSIVSNSTLKTCEDSFYLSSEPYEISAYPSTAVNSIPSVRYLAHDGSWQEV